MDVANVNKAVNAVVSALLHVIIPLTTHTSKEKPNPVMRVYKPLPYKTHILFCFAFL